MVKNFKENLSKLRPVDDIEQITLYNSKGDIVSQIPNVSGKQGSLAVYANQLGFESGSIAPEDRVSMLETFGEHTQDAHAHRGKHPNIDVLLEGKASSAWIDFKVSNDLQERVDKFVEMKAAGTLMSEKSAALDTFNELADYVEAGKLRTATFVGTGWKASEWVKKGLMLAFPLGGITVYNEGNDITFTDKATLPIRTMKGDEGFRVVPPAAGLRRASYAGQGATFMPPAYMNMGGWVGQDGMIENLVGSCAQVGKKGHISAGAIIGGVLDPLEATPCILGDHAMLGENAGITQGVRLGDIVTLSAGVHINKGSPVIDPINGVAYTKNGTHELIIDKSGEFNKYSVGKILEEKDNSYGPVIPSGAVVINGVGLSRNNELRQAPTIVKYVTSPSDRSFELNNDLRK